MCEKAPSSLSAERRFRRIAKQSPIGIYVLQDGHFVFVNPQFKHCTGYTWTETAQMTPDAIIHPEDRESVRQSATRMLKYGGREPYQYRALHKNGEVRWIIETVSSMVYRGRRATVGNFMDYTDQKTAELSYRRLAAAVEHAVESIVIADTNGTIQYVNPSFEKVSRFSRSEIIGQNLRALQPDPDDQAGHKAILHHLSSGKTW